MNTLIDLKSSGGILSLLSNSVSLFQDGELDTVALGESDGGLASRADNKHVLQTGGERVAGGVSDNNNIKSTRVVLDVDDTSNTSSVTSLVDHDGGASLELELSNRFARLNVDLDGVVNLDERVGVTDGTAVVGDDVRDLLGGDGTLLHAAQLPLLLLVGDAVKNVASLGIEYQAELIASLGDLDDVHETSRVVGISAGLAVNLDQLLHADHLGLLTGKGVFKAVSQNEDDGE